MVFRVYVEKKQGLDHEAASLCREINTFLGIDALTRVRVINRYDVENTTTELFEYATKTVLSEPQLDNVSDAFDAQGAQVFAVEFLPGQYDQRADSAAQCMQIISCGDRPTVRTAKVYLLYGELTQAQVAAIKKHVINPVESREANNLIYLNSYNIQFFVLNICLNQSRYVLVSNHSVTYILQ